MLPSTGGQPLDSARASPDALLSVRLHRVILAYPLISCRPRNIAAKPCLPTTPYTHPNGPALISVVPLSGEPACGFWIGAERGGRSCEWPSLRNSYLYGAGELENVAARHTGIVVTPRCHWRLRNCANTEKRNYGPTGFSDRLS